jgi:hypothetical protein
MFTPAEATALVPRLNHEFSQIALLRPEILELTERLGGADEALRVLEGEAEAPPARRAEAERLREISAEVHAAVERIQGLGAVVKDIDAGLVDFYGKFEGRTVFLCWHFGEDRVAHFHELDEGFSSRKPLQTVSSRGLLN